MEMAENDRKAENDRVEALQMICQATQNQFEKTTTTVSTTPAKGMDTQMQRHYSASLKRK